MPGPVLSSNSITDFLAFTPRSMSSSLNPFKLDHLSSIFTFNYRLQFITTLNIQNIVSKIFNIVPLRLNIKKQSPFQDPRKYNYLYILSLSIEIFRIIIIDSAFFPKYVFFTFKGFFQLLWTSNTSITGLNFL